MRSYTRVVIGLVLINICYDIPYMRYFSRVFYFADNLSGRIFAFKLLIYAMIYRICGIFRGSYISRITCLEGFSHLNFC